MSRHNDAYRPGETGLVPMFLLFLPYYGLMHVLGLEPPGTSGYALWNAAYYGGFGLWCLLLFVLYLVITTWDS